MRTFRFRLERVLRWRRTQLDFEESRMKQLTAGLRRIEAAREALEEARGAARREVLSSGHPDGAELAQLACHLRRLKNDERRLAESRLEQQRRIETQRDTLLEARRRLRLLERLKEKRLEEWQQEEQREIEVLAGETFLARRQARIGRTDSGAGR
jgi:flagellar export protein FliJ